MTILSVELKTLKQGDLFKRKLSSDNVFVRGHYNRKDQFGPAGYQCSNYFDMNSEIHLKGSSLVFIDFEGI